MTAFTQITNTLISWQNKTGLKHKIKLCLALYLLTTATLGSFHIVWGIWDATDFLNPKYIIEAFKYYIPFLLDFPYALIAWIYLFLSLIACVLAGYLLFIAIFCIYTRGTKQVFSTKISQGIFKFLVYPMSFFGTFLWITFCIAKF